MTTATAFALARRLAPFWLPVLAASPSLAWLALARAVWPWDQAWFGAHTVTLYETLRANPLDWPAALARAAPWKPPAVAWIGQFFVPIGVAVGSVDTGLGLSIWTCHVAALMLVFQALRELSGGRMSAASAGTLLLAAAPIFIFLSTQYLAEGSQTLAVAWFVFIMSRAPRWSRSMITAHLVAATSFAMVAKTTSPLYCAAPGLVALIAIVRTRTSSSAAAHRPRRAAWPWWVLALVLAISASAWYARNFEGTLHHATIAAFGPVAELYGKREGFFAGLVHWLTAATQVFFLPPVAALVGAIVLLGVAKRLFRGPVGAPSYADLCAGAAVLQILLALAVFALASNRDPRYLEPLLPLVAVVICWALVHIEHAGAAVVVLVALGLQLAAVQTQVLGLWPARAAVLRAVSLDPALAVVDRDPGPARVLTAIVERTCGHGGFGSHNLVGVDLLHLSGHSLTYAAAKERLAGRAGECRYDSIGFGSLESARAEVNAREYVYWITVDPRVHPIPPYIEFANRSAPVVFRQLRRKGVLQPEPWNGPTGVVLFRFGQQ